MAAGSRTDGGNQVISLRVRKIIQSIREIVGNHSDADIYAVLKESNMDPNETAQKLLNQDPFHEVKRRRDKKKEVAGGQKVYSDTRRQVEHISQVTGGQKVFFDTRRRVEHTIQPAISHPTWDRNVRRGGYVRNSVPVISREFRIVRDNRVKQNASDDVKPELVHPASDKEQMKTDLPEKSMSGTHDRKQPVFASSEGSVLSQHTKKPLGYVPGGPGHKKDQSSTLRPSLPQKTSPTATVTNSEAARVVKDNSRAHSTSTATNSVIGVYCSSSDPVHVPSSASRLAGTVGAIRREVGVVGVRKQSLNHPNSNSPVSNSSFSVPAMGTDVSSSSNLFEQSVAASKSSQFKQAAESEPTVGSIPVNRPSSGGQYNSRTHQQPIGHPKAMQSIMEWKPKSNQKPAVTMSGTASAPGSSHNDNSSDSIAADAANLSEKLTKVTLLDERHVIIPNHLRVPESERTQLTFGSFGAGFDSTNVSSSVSQAFDSAELLSDGPSVSVSASVPVGSAENDSAADQEDLSDFQATTGSECPDSAAESEQAPPDNESFDQQNVENYADIGLAQGHGQSYTSSHAHHLQSPTGLPSFSEYDSQKSYHLPFLRTVMDDNAHNQALASSSEALSSHVNSSPPSTVTLMQQQQQTLQHQQHTLLQQQQQQQQQQNIQQQQQQNLANMYPQVQFPHFPNFMPYRHIFSPVYVPPMAMPNYSGNSAYPHPSNGSSYLLMPGGSSHVSAGGMKFGTTQYKPVPAGNPTAYGNYVNPTGFTISPPGSVGTATGLDDASRIKYKDNNLYVPNPQAETSDIWIQTTPRDLPSLQSAPYYNLAGQPPHAAAAFVPAAHAAHASFNAAAAQPSHVQYPGLYHPPASPAPIGGAHHLVHQSGLGGSISGVGVAAAAPGTQVGAYQQAQLSHLNWPANY